MRYNPLMNTKILTVLTFSLLLSACTIIPTSKPSSNTTEPKKGVFTSIKDAVTRQVALKCEYNDDGEITTTYIKGQVVRLVGNNKSAGVEGLMKDGKFYLWNSQSNSEKKGMIINMSTMEGAKMGETTIKSVDDVITVLESKKESCTASTESDTLFQLPADITFAEVSDLFNATPSATK